MSEVPSNLIPTRITQLPYAPVASEESLLLIVYQGNTYQIMAGDLLQVAGVPTSRQVIAGTGLTGGGQLTDNVTLSIANGGVGTTQLSSTGVTAGQYGSATEIPVFSVDAKGRITAATTIPATVSGYVPVSREVIAGEGLNGGGPLNANVTLNVDLASATPLPGDQAGSAGSSTDVARADHVHPAVDLSDADEVDGILGLSNGGTAKSLVANAGAIIWSGADGLYVGPAGVAGQILQSNGTSQYVWVDQSGLDVGQADNLNGGAANRIAVQTAPDTTGFVSAPTVTDTFLKWNGSSLVWDAAAGAGTVTSVNASGGTTGMTFSGGPITAAGTLTLGGTLGVANGGTGGTTAATARSNLSAAKSGANTDITSVALTTGTVSTSPTADTDIANKIYVDNLYAAGVNYHQAVKYEVPNTTGNLNATYNNGTAGVGATLTNAGTLGAFTPDGVVASVNDRILIYNQTNAYENGVYVVTTVGNGSTPWVLTRSSDTNTYGATSPTALGQGDAFYVTSGNTGAGETYICTTSGPITFGTTAITFAQISAVQVYSAGTGLTLTNTTFSLTSPVAVSLGGTGATSLTSGYLVKGNGTSAVSASVVYDDGTNVGIGTSSPGNRLTVSGSGDVAQFTNATRSAYIALDSGGFSMFTGASQTGNGIYANATSNYTALYTASSERMRIDSSGNVIIGTTATNNKFFVTYSNPSSVPAAGAGGHCTAFGAAGYGLTTGALSNGNAYLQATRWDGTAINYDLLLQPNGGNVGIGTSSPGAKLDVAGTGYFSDNVTLSRTNTAGSLSGMTITNAGTTAAYAGININSGTVTSQLFNDAAGNAVVAGTVLRTTSNHPLVFGTNATERMRIDASGNLLVGKTATSVGTDGVQLIAGGFSGFSAPGTTALFLNRNTNDGTILEFGRNGVSAATMGLSSSALTFGTAGSEQMRLTTGGNLGIGVTNPSAKIDLVAGSGTAQVGLRIRSAAANSNGFNILTNSTTDEVSLTNFYNASVILGTNNTERMRLDASGNLGLGVTPSAWSGLASALQVQNASIVTSSTAATDTYFSSNAYYNAGWKYVITGTATRYVQNATGDHRWYTAGSGTAGNAISFTQAMTLDASGNVGIGTSSPTAYSGYTSLEIDNASNGGILSIKKAGSVVGYLNGASGLLLLAQSNDLKLTTTGSTSMQFSTDATERMRIDSSGNLLVGTTSAIGKITAYSASNGDVLAAFRCAGTGTQRGLYVSADNSTGVVSLDATGAAAGILAFKYGGTEAMRITSAGDVGIGTSSPSTKLDVSGTVKATAFTGIDGGTF